MSGKRKSADVEEWEKDLAEEDKTPDPSKPRKVELRRCAHCQQSVDASGREDNECAVCEGWMCKSDCKLHTIRRCLVRGCNEPIACINTLPRTNEHGCTCGTCNKMFCTRHKRGHTELCGGSLCSARLCRFCAMVRPFCRNCVPPHLDRDNNNKNEQQS